MINKAFCDKNPIGCSDLFELLRPFLLRPSTDTSTKKKVTHGGETHIVSYTYSSVEILDASIPESRFRLGPLDTLDAVPSTNIGYSILQRAIADKGIEKTLETYPAPPRVLARHEGSQWLIELEGYPEVSWSVETLPLLDRAQMQLWIPRHGEPFYKFKGPGFLLPPMRFVPRDFSGNREVFIDTEFITWASRGVVTNELLSLALVDPAGAELHLHNLDADLSHADGFVTKHVLPLLPPRDDPSWVSHKEIASRVSSFLLSGDQKPRIWGWYSAHDFVNFCGLYGGMMKIPEGIPRYFRDLKTLSNSCWTIPSPEKPQRVHDALADAKWNLAYFSAIEKIHGHEPWFRSI